MGLKIKTFTDLKAWRESHKLVMDIYKITKEFPPEEKFVLVSQMRRAAISITSNIAEGFGRTTYKDKLRFYCMAQGSLTEIKNQLIVARDLNYLKREEFNKIALQANEAHKLSQGLMTKTKEFVNLNS
jgi:four helix bundle protein